MAKPKRKTIILVAFSFLVIIFLIHLVSALTLDRTIQYVETSFSSAKISPVLNGYVIAFVSDTHEISAETLEAVVTRIKRRQIDLLLLGGDYARDEGYWQTMEILGKASARDGIYGVDGNHDQARLVFEAMQKYGINPLDNQGLEIRSGFYLAGVADLWNRRPDMVKALAMAKPDDFVLVVSHNPDVSMRQDTTGVDVMLSGHTHGGEITFFGVWAPALWLVTDYGHKFQGGWTDAPCNTAVFVSKGTGNRKTKRVPYYPRVFARPQVIFLTLKAL